MYSIKKKQQTTPVKEQNCGCRDRSTRLRCSPGWTPLPHRWNWQPHGGTPCSLLHSHSGIWEAESPGQSPARSWADSATTASQEDRSLRRASSSQHTATTGLLGTSLNKTPNFLQQEPICSSKTTAGLSMVGTEEPAPCLTVAAPVGQDAAPAHEGPPSVPT